MPQPAEATEVELVTSEGQNCLERVVKELGVKDFTTEISAGSSLGDNYLGIIAKVVVKGKDKDGKDTTLNFIVKSAPSQGYFRTISPLHTAYEREVYSYSRVLPEFEKLQEERGVIDPFKSYPKYYKSTMRDMNEALIMENMKEIGFKLQDRHQTLDYNHVLLVLKEYGKFHAISFAMRDQKPELFKELSGNTEDIFFVATMYNMKQMGDMVKQRNLRTLQSLDPIKHKVAYERLKKFHENMEDPVKKAVASESAGKYAVITHGDCWINNILYKYANPSKPDIPTEACLLDWQLSRLGSPALDLSHFLFLSTDRDLRDEHYDNLIKEYYNSLATHLRKLGSDPEELFPFDILQQHLKEYSVYGLYMVNVVLPAIIREVEEIPDLINQITEIEDARELYKHELYQNVPKNLDKFNSRISGVVLDFIKLGYNF